jgi:hypothetical protein
MHPVRLFAPLTLLAGSLLVGLPAALAGQGSSYTPWLALLLGLAGCAFLAASTQRGSLAMSWLRSLIARKRGDFSAAPPARRLTIRIRCHR